MPQPPEISPLNSYLSDSHAAKTFRPVSVCRLLFEDTAIFVVDKKPGVLSTPIEGKTDESVVAALERYAKRKSQKKTQVIAVHRLDREASGVLVVAKSVEASENLIAQFKQRKPKREYLVILAGAVIPDTGRLEDKVFVDKFFNQKVARKGRIGQLAVLNYEVLAQHSKASLVKVSLETGRKNQIRVQFAHRGFPVLGDKRYEPEKARHPKWTAKRLALHAAQLEFLHPLSGEPLAFQAGLPEEFSAFLKS